MGRQYSLFASLAEYPPLNVGSTKGWVIDHGHWVNRLSTAWVRAFTSTIAARNKFQASACLQLPSPKSNKKTSTNVEHQTGQVASTVFPIFSISITGIEHCHYLWFAQPTASLNFAEKMKHCVWNTTVLSCLSQLKSGSHVPYCQCSWILYTT